MDTAIGTFQAHKEAAPAPKRGKIDPIDIISHERREIDEKTVTDLIEALARDGRFLHQIAVRDEGATGYRLIAGHHRLEAWKRHFGKQAPIPADIYSSDTPDERITILEIEENLLRKELNAAERQAEKIRLAAALKKLNGGELVTPVSASGRAAKSGTMSPSLARARGGRGNKGMAQQVAERVGISKRSVNRDVEAASAAIGEKIDLDRDTPEELERKADKRKRAEPKVVRLKRRKTEPRGVTEDPTQPAGLGAGDIDSRIEDLWKAFTAVDRTYQLRFIHDACVGLGLDPLKMAPAALFGLAEEEHELAVNLPAEVASATGNAAQDSLATDDERDDSLSTDDGTVDSQAEPQDESADLGAEHLPDTGDNVSEAADQEHLGAEDRQDADGDVSEGADQEPGAAATCAYCNHPFGSLDQRHVVNGRAYHDGFCLDYARRIATAAA